MYLTSTHKKCFTIVLSMIAMMLFPAASVMADVTGNDGPGSAEPFPVAGTVTGHLNTTDDTTDYYFKDLLGGEAISLTVKNGPASVGNITVELDIPNSTIVLRTPISAPDTENTISFVTNNSNTGHLLIKVSLKSGNNSTYSVSATFTAPNDAGSLSDAPDDACCSITLTGQKMTFKGSVGPGDNKMGTDMFDLYSFQVPPNHDIIINGTTNSTKGDNWVELHHITMTVLPYFRGFISMVSPLNVNVHGGPEGGNFFFRVVWASGGQVTYYFNVSLKETPDLQKPTLAVDAVPSSTISKNIIISGNITDDRAVDQVDASINSGAPTICPGSHRFHCSLALFEGTNYIVIRGFDKSGNYAMTDISVSYTPGPSGPQGIDVTITVPSSGIKVDDEDIQLIGVINRTDGSTTVDCSGDGGMTYQGATRSGNGWTCSVELSSKANTVVVRAIHSDGSQDQATITVYRNISDQETESMGTQQMALAILVLVLIMTVLFIVNEMYDIGKKEQKGSGPRPIPKDAEEE